jgi:hypothetical protein
VKLDLSLMEELRLKICHNSVLRRLSKLRVEINRRLERIA